jgi:hypothetical protein
MKHLIHVSLWMYEGGFQQREHRRQVGRSAWTGERHQAR